MRAIRTGAALESARATRQDLMLETLALRHQLAVLVRSKRRFRPPDRLYWLLLPWRWPRWREALMLIQPPSVDRWHREDGRRCWPGRPRRPRRPRIDPACRDLIRRIAAENCLWRAPRIHGDLLKLGLAISERAISRYPCGRPTTRSQTWRTFFANHFCGQTFSPLMFADAAVDVSHGSFRSTPSIDASCAFVHGANVDCG
jgi:putative transposase